MDNVCYMFVVASKQESSLLGYNMHLDITLSGEQHHALWG